MNAGSDGRVDDSAPLALPVAGTSSADEERLARLELSLVTEPGHPRLANLVGAIGPVEARERLRAGGDGIPPSWHAAVHRDVAQRAQELLGDSEQRDWRWVCPGDDGWPDCLDDLAHAEELQERGGIPLGVWLRGRAELASLDDLAYPTAHQAMLERIAGEGLVVSELCPGSRPSRVRFLARNRLIAALASGTVVVEAARRSGALNTLNWANRLGRPTIGVPGPVTSSASAGVHQVIRDAGAVLVTGGDEVAEVVSPLGSDTVGWKPGERRLTDGLAADELAVLEAVPPRRAAGIAMVAAEAHVDMATAITVLGRLLRSGLVERTGDGWRLSPQTVQALRRR